jgi:hypothetical protein
MMDDLDFDDPALNAMLGIEAAPNVAGGAGKSREEEVKEKDKGFGEVRLPFSSLSLFLLISDATIARQIPPQFRLFRPHLENLPRHARQRTEDYRPDQVRAGSDRVLGEVHCGGGRAWRYRSFPFLPLLRDERD